MNNVRQIIRNVLEGECASRCMDDADDREATIDALARALQPMTAMKESDNIRTWAMKRGYHYYSFLHDPDGSGEYADVVVDGVGHWVLWRDHEGRLCMFQHDENLGDTPIRINELPV